MEVVMEMAFVVSDDEVRAFSCPAIAARGGSMGCAVQGPASSCPSSPVLMPVLLPVVVVPAENSWCHCFSICRTVRGCGVDVHRMVGASASGCQWVSLSSSYVMQKPGTRSSRPSQRALGLQSLYTPLKPYPSSLLSGQSTQHSSPKSSCCPLWNVGRDWLAAAPLAVRLYDRFRKPYCCWLRGLVLVGGSEAVPVRAYLLVVWWCELGLSSSTGSRIRGVAAAVATTTAAEAVAACTPLMIASAEDGSSSEVPATVGSSSSAISVSATHRPQRLWVGLRWGAGRRAGGGVGGRRRTRRGGWTMVMDGGWSAAVSVLLAGAAAVPASMSVGATSVSGRACTVPVMLASTASTVVHAIVVGNRLRSCGFGVPSSRSGGLSVALYPSHVRCRGRGRKSRGSEVVTDAVVVGGWRGCSGGSGCDDGCGVVVVDARVGFHNQRSCARTAGARAKRTR